MGEQRNPYCLPSEKRLEAEKKSIPERYLDIIGKKMKWEHEERIPEYFTYMCMWINSKSFAFQRHYITSGYG